jgi:hypothetical protein
MRNCTRDGGRPSEIGNQVLISSHRKLLLSKAMVVSVAENVWLAWIHKNYSAAAFPDKRHQ